MNSSRSQAMVSADDKLTLDDDVENRIMNSKVSKILDSKVNSGKQQDHKVANIDRSSKWSKFLSDDVMHDGREMSCHTMSDCPVTSACSFAVLQPFVVSTAVLFLSQYIIAVYYRREFCINRMVFCGKLVHFMALCASKG